MSSPEKWAEIDSIIEDMLAGSTPLTEIERRHNFTPADIVNEDEVYLLKRNPDYNPNDRLSPVMIRDKRICGYIRSGTGGMLRCLMPAGFRTNHNGMGKCHKHELQFHRVLRSRQRFKLLEGYAAKGWALRLKEMHLHIDDLLSDPHLGDIEEEIVVLNMMLKFSLNASVPDTAEICAITETIAKVKMARQKIRTEKLLFDANSVKLFVGGIMDVLKRNLGQAQYSKIAAELMSVAVPISKQMQSALAEKKSSEVPSDYEEITDAK